MIINSGTIREAFQSFNTVFNKAFHEMEAQYPRVAMEVPSETRDENYAWLGAVPSMREWIGDREIKNLAAYGYTIRNKDFEATVTVPRNDLEDDCIGVYKPVFQDLAYSARKHPDKLVFGLFPRSFTEKCFDGKPFISDDHIGRNPDLDTTQATSAILKSGLLQKISSAEEEFNDMPIEKAGRLFVQLIKADADRKRTDYITKRKAELALDQMEADLLAQIRQYPDLTSQLKDVLNQARTRIIGSELE